MVKHSGLLRSVDWSMVTETSKTLRFPRTSVSSQPLYQPTRSNVPETFNLQERHSPKWRIINSADSDYDAIYSCANAVVRTRKGSWPSGRQKRSYTLQQEFDVTGFTADRILRRKPSHSYTITEYSVKMRQ